MSSQKDSLTPAQREFSKLVAELLVKEWDKEQRRLADTKTKEVEIDGHPVKISIRKAPRGLAMSDWQ